MPNRIRKIDSALRESTVRIDERVGLAGHNKNLVVMVVAAAVRLSPRHGKVRRDGYWSRVEQLANPSVG